MRISAWSSDVCSSDLGIGRNPVLFIEQLVGDEAEFDRKPQPRPQGFAADAGKIWKARVRQPVGDMPVRFEPDMDELRRGVERTKDPTAARPGPRPRGLFGQEFANIMGQVGTEDGWGQGV